MIATAISANNHQEKFLELLPTIRIQAQVAFRNERLDRRRERVAEVIANAWVAFVRLMERGMESIIFPTPLAQYAIKQVRSGRRVGGKLNIGDVTSRYCQRAKGITVERLDAFDEASSQWQEVVVEDKNATPAAVAITRIDFSNWLLSLRPKHRRIAKSLATGETTSNAARIFRLSSGRISQLRKELRDGWLAFQGELAVA
jgi:hypothetical protein